MCEIFLAIVSGEFDDRLHNFESQMADQMNILKTMILNIEDKLAQQETQNRKSSRALFHAISDVGEAMAGCSDVKSGNYPLLNC